MRYARFMLFTTVLAAATFAAPAARADTVFNSFGPNDAFDPFGTPFSVSGGAQFEQAVRFVPAANVQVTDVRLFARSTGGNNMSSLRVVITTESGMLPAAGELWSSNPQTVNNAGALVVFTSPTSASLTAGQPYWLVVQGTLSQGNAAVVVAGDPPVQGIRAQRTSLGAWTRTEGADLPAVRIEGASGGACCNTENGGCVVLDSARCQTLGLRFDGVGATCSPASCRACPGDYNRSGVKSVQDLFDFLAAYFSACP